MTNLYETINTQKDIFKRFDPESLLPPIYITNNLKFDFFEWQKEAFENFLFYQDPKSQLQKSPTHLMFNMATGTGKTMLMAALILYYYKQGYRHFVFFVNQNNIVDKTENNFINPLHTKYLFTEKIVIDNKTVNIKKVDLFSENPEHIEIKFTTIQKLYNDIHLERENQTTLEDLHSKNIVMLADEAHHLNTDTQNQNDLVYTELKDNASVKDIEKKGWEHTVIELILNKNSRGIDNKNVLLEFTATIPKLDSIVKKYENKIIYKFDLKDFLSKGYTKEINLISSTFEKKERVLQALLFNWYRHKIALKNNILNFKPVILFRSKTIEESKNDYIEFLNWIENINIDDFSFLNTISNKIPDSTNVNEQGKSRIQNVLEFIKSENISLSELVDFIRIQFQEKNLIITNSENNKTKKEKTTEDQEKLLNSLEDKNNHIRAIFTVDRLTEGWDVLNLFDIVRLYQGQNAGGNNKGKTPEATTKEKQLIGRGVRYFPFTYKENIKNKRKFDNDLNNELRILEELFYYTYDEESRYISHLKKELKEDGYITDTKIIKKFDLKEDFRKSDFFKNTIVWTNDRVENINRRKTTLEDLIDLEFEYKIKGLEVVEEEIIFDKKGDNERLHIQQSTTKTIDIKVKDIEKNIFEKAVNIKAKEDSSLFQFDNLKNELEIESIEDLQKEDFLGNFNIKIIVDKNTNYNDIDGKEKLNIVIKFLEKIFTELKNTIHPYKGSEFKQSSFSNIFKEPKIKSVETDEESDRIYSTIQDKDWFVLNDFYGTSEEQELIEFIKNTMGSLEERYKDIYLLRNEEIYKIYDFEQGRGFQPDFILFLKNNTNELKYQIFIEPKGNDYIGEDGTFKTGKEGWKEEFLEEINCKYGLEQIIRAEHKNYRLIGLPFFNKDHNTYFNSEFNTLQY